MPDEEGNQEAEEVPETSLHAHGSGVEEENDRPREDQAEGNIVEEVARRREARRVLTRAMTLRTSSTTRTTRPRTTDLTPARPQATAPTAWAPPSA
jgi:hypothetical protein